MNENVSDVILGESEGSYAAKYVKILRSFLPQDDTATFLVTGHRALGTGH